MTMLFWIGAITLIGSIVAIIKVLRGVEVETIILAPLEHGDMMECRECNSFWHILDEEIHYKGCMISEARKARGYQ